MDNYPLFSEHFARGLANGAQGLILTGRDGDELVDPGVVVLRGGSRALHYSKAREVILSGPSETGKTTSALIFLHNICCAYPNVQAVMTRKILQSTHSTVMRSYQSKILPLSAEPVTIYGGSKPQWFDYANGSRIWVVGMDNASSVLSGEFDIVYANQAEELTLEDWEYLRTRTSGRSGNTPYGILLGDCNPSHPKHWILDRVKAGHAEFLTTLHSDNPRLFDAAGAVTPAGQETIAALESLTGVRRMRLYEGKWAQAEGVVYPDYSYATHVVPRFEIPREWRRIRAIDFGYNNPFVCLWIAISPDDVGYCYRELYMTQHTVREMAQLIKSYSAGERIEATICDHDAEDRATLTAAGISNIAAYKDVSLGIQEVAADLKNGRLFFFRDMNVEPDQELIKARKAASVIDEFDLYTWPKSVDGRVVKEAPLKENDHGQDTLRYATCYIRKVGRRPSPPAASYNARTQQAQVYAAEDNFSVVGNPLPESLGMDSLPESL